MSDPHHSIRAVARKTGLSPHVIRIWKRRYNVIAAVRTSINRRLYSDAGVSRLELLKSAIGARHSISAIAKVSSEDLAKLLIHVPEQPAL